MKVREIMTRNPSTAELESTTEEIASIMKEEDVTAIAVLDEDNELAGVITDRDIVVLCIAEGHDASECKAEDILSKKIWLKSGVGFQAASPDMDPKEAAQMMRGYQISRLPVIEEGRLVGMISLTDVIKQTGNQEFSLPTSGSEAMPGKESADKHSNKAGRVSQIRPNQNKVVPMREDNRVRNRNVASPAGRKKAS
jgi:CBS domain-containing protein